MEFSVNFEAEYDEVPIETIKQNPVEVGQASNADSNIEEIIIDRDQHTKTKSSIFNSSQPMQDNSGHSFICLSKYLTLFQKKNLLFQTNHLVSSC
jgi:hypothetical protein